MALFDRTAGRLGRGPAVLFPADPADAMAEAVLRYDPAADVKSDKFVFRNGVHLHGPAGIDHRNRAVARHVKDAAHAFAKSRQDFLYQAFPVIALG